VTLISGPTQLSKPLNVDLINIKTADDMLSQVLKHVTNDAIFISCAAVADYRFATQAFQKIKKDNATLNLELIKNPDILTTITSQKLAKYTVGFAAETNDLLVNAQNKFKNKQVDMLIANEVGENIGFNSNENAATIFLRKQTLSFVKQSKIALAAKITKILSTEIKNS
jgi:phosphopantothenoylcysteine decarboxylase/phosphopantothenate--cysteine ligase